MARSQVLAARSSNFRQVLAPRSPFRPFSSRSAPVLACSASGAGRPEIYRLTVPARGARDPQEALLGRPDFSTCGGVSIGSHPRCPEDLALGAQPEAAVRARDPYPGFYVPAIDAATLAGDTVRLGECAPRRIQLLFVFSTTCDFCRASLTAWKTIASELRDDSGVEIYGISVDSVEATRAFLAQHDIEFPVVSFAERKVRALYRSGIVPQTVVLDAEGMVRYARLGAITEAVVVDSVLAQASATSTEWAAAGRH